MNKNLLKFLIAGLLPVFMLACKKNNTAVDVDPIIPPELARVAMTATVGQFDITSNSTTYNVPIGITNVSNVDRTVHIEASSATGAVEGTHFTVPSTIVIPAGKALDSLPVTFLFPEYQTGRRDSVTITIVEGGVKPAPFSNRFTVYGKGPCYEGNVTDVMLIGDYDNTNEDWGGSAYGPYTTTISNWTQAAGATTATIQVENLFDFGWAPVTFTLDWTDPNNRTVTLVEQSGIAGGHTISATYAGEDVSVRPFAGSDGTFSVCEGRVVLRMQLGITGLGWFGDLYEVVLQR